jgi:branched-chain amino acid transport system ATP-binding protein
MANAARPLLVAAVGLAALPFVLDAVGLPLRSAIDVVALAIACMGLNVLVGYTGLVSFGHGAWFGLAAYAAALSQRHLFPDMLFVPAVFAIAFVAAASTLLGALILRRRGVYFSLLTLALAAMLFAVAYRWTAFTGGESGLGGITRTSLLGIDLADDKAYYALAAITGMGVVYGLWRFHRSPVGTVLVAIRENEERARFVGYPTNRYKLIGFTISATVVAAAGVISVFNHRFASAEPISVAFSGELLAMVVIGGMRSFLGPALGALFYILFREFLSIWTVHWLFWFGLLFMGFIVFSPTGLVGVAERLMRPFRKVVEEEAAMAGRQAGSSGRVPAHLIRQGMNGQEVLIAQSLSKRFGGIRAVKDADITVKDCTLHALIGPNGAGKTTAFNLLSGSLLPDTGAITLEGRPITGLRPEAITAAGVGRSFQITNLFGGLSVEENIRLAVQARHARRFGIWSAADRLGGVQEDTSELLRWAGLAGAERADAASLSYGGQRLLDMGLALATKPRILLLDEPLAGLAAAERGRVAGLIKTLSADIPVLLVEHDIDRVFQIADAVTVMNDGEVLVDGTAEDARSDARVQAIYIGSGSAAVAAKARVSAAASEPLLQLDSVNTFYGKSHILNDVSFSVHEREIVALLGRNGAGKSTLLKTLVGITPPASGEITLAGAPIAREPSHVITRKGVGYVPQGRGLFAGLTVAQNLELGRMRRITGSGKHWELECVLDTFPRVRERLHTPADYLSGGEQQMVAVGRALIGDVRILLLDEPFEGLSPAVTEELFEAFDRLRQEIAIVIVDHHLDLALALSDRTVVLERGAVTYDGPSQALRDDLGLRRKVLWL